MSLCWSSNQYLLMSNLAETTLERWGGQKDSSARNVKHNNNQPQLEPFFIKFEGLFKKYFAVFTLWKHLKKYANLYLQGQLNKNPCRKFGLMPHKISCYSF